MKTVRKRKTADERKIDKFLRDYMGFVMSRLSMTPLLYSMSNGRYKPKKNTESTMIHKLGGYVLDERALDKYVNTVLSNPKKSGILQIDSSTAVPRLLSPRLFAQTRQYKKPTPIDAEKIHADAKIIHVDAEKIQVDHEHLLKSLKFLINAFRSEILAFELYDRILEKGLREQLNVACGGIHAYIAKGPVPKEWNYVGDIYRAPVL
jgi:hypothetical protein